MEEAKADMDTAEVDDPPTPPAEKEKKENPQSKGGEVEWNSSDKEKSSEEQLEDGVGRGNATTAQESSGDEPESKYTILPYTNIQYVDEDWTPEQREPHTVYITPDRREYIPGHDKPVKRPASIKTSS